MRQRNMPAVAQARLSSRRSFPPVTLPAPLPERERVFREIEGLEIRHHVHARR